MLIVVIIIIVIIIIKRSVAILAQVGMGPSLGFRSRFGAWPPPIKVETRLSSCCSLSQFTMALLFCIRVLLVAWTTRLGRAPNTLCYGSEGLPEPEPISEGWSSFQAEAPRGPEVEMRPQALGLWADHYLSLGVCGAGVAVLMSHTPGVFVIPPPLFVSLCVRCSVSVCMATPPIVVAGEVCP